MSSTRVKATFKWVWTVVFVRKWPASVARLSLLAVMALALVAFYQESHKDEIVVDPILAPEELVKAGWTDEVLARAIGDEIHRIDSAKVTDYPHAAYGLPPKEPELTLPGAKISLKALVSLVRDVIDAPPKRLVQEVVSLSMQDIGKDCGGLVIDGSTQYQLRARLRPTGSSWIVCGITMDDLLRRAAEEAVRHTHPYRYALFVYEKDRDYALVEKIARAMLQSTQANDHPWALNLLGFVHSRYGHWVEDERTNDRARKEFELANQMFEAAYSADSTFANGHANSGWELIYLHRYAEAIPEFEKAICSRKYLGRDPFSSSYTGLGFAYLTQNRIEDAIRSFETAFKMNPNSVDRFDSEDSYVGLYRAWLKKNNIIKDEPGFYQGKRNYIGKADSILELRECLESHGRDDYCRVRHNEIWNEIENVSLMEYYRLMVVCGFYSSIIW